MKVDIHTIAAELNSRAGTHAIGSLQEIRAGLKGLSRKPVAIFSVLRQLTTTELFITAGDLSFNSISGNFPTPMDLDLEWPSPSSQVGAYHHLLTRSLQSSGGSMTSCN